MAQYIPGAFNEEDLPFARTRREYRDFQRFDKAMKDAQSTEKEQLTKNINLAAQIAAGLSSTEAIKHVVNRLCLVSKDPDTRKETAVYAADSIMRHVAVADEVLLARYEKQLALHLRNIFKRTLRQSSTRLTLASKFFTKILPKWKEKGWFAKELDSIVEAVHRCAPSLTKPDVLSKQHHESAALDADEPILPLAEADDTAGAAEAAEHVARPPGLGFGATAKAGSPATPAQPEFLVAPRTPRAFRIPSTPVPSQLEVSQAVLHIIPGTPRPPEGMSVPQTPGREVLVPVPSTPGRAGPSAMVAPFTPQPGHHLGTAQPFTPRLIAPFTPAGAGGGSVQPFTPRGPAPATPAGSMQPFTPRGPPPATPGLAQPFTPRGPPPATPVGYVVQPFTPRGPAPATPSVSVQPFTPRGPGVVQPFTPGAPPPATPGVQLLASQPFTPVTGSAPGTPGFGAPGTPGFIPFRGGEAAPVTPSPGGFRPSAPSTPGMAAPGTPGFVPFTGGEAAPCTPAFPGARHDTKAPIVEQPHRELSDRVSDVSAVGVAEASTSKEADPAVEQAPALQGVGAPLTAADPGVVIASHPAEHAEKASQAAEAPLAVADPRVTIAFDPAGRAEKPPAEGNEEPRCPTEHLEEPLAPDALTDAPDEEAPKRSAESIAAMDNTDIGPTPAKRLRMLASEQDHSSWSVNPVDGLHAVGMPPRLEQGSGGPGGLVEGSSEPAQGNGEAEPETG